MQKYETDWSRIPVIFDLAYAGMLLGTSQDRLSRMSQHGEFPAFKVGRLWKVNKDKLLTWMDDQEIKEVSA